ncbi:MAG: hypothetical protein ACLFS7_06665 [Desulfosudaceae bacterium]
MDSTGQTHVIYKPMSSKSAKTVKMFPDPSPTSKLAVKDKPQLISLNERTGSTRGKKSGKIKYLIDRINYLNFQDESLLLSFQHKRHDYRITKHVIPQPCRGNTLECRWTDISDLIPVLKNYRLKALLIPDNNQVLRVVPGLVSVTKKRIILKLPAQYEEINKRRVKRFDSKDIQVQMIQNSVIYRGQLLDFSTMAFHIRLHKEISPTFKWINPNIRVNLVFLSGRNTAYSGECQIFKQTDEANHRDIVLEPLNFEIQRFKPKEVRTTRQELIPSPDAIIIHPLTRKKLQLKIQDMSGSGFSVEESQEDAMLLPGLVAADTELKFGNQFILRCQGQIIYSHPIEDKEDTVRCGISILDMDVNDHMNLLALLGQAEDKNSYLCDTVDMDLLWDFFFRTGVIYSDKYEVLHHKKEEIKKTYENLYNRNPHIARHFIYQDKGAILGHMAMLRFYEKSWLLCLHASQNSMPRVNQKLSLLNQASRYVYESYTFSSANLDYLVTYYDANDKFSRSIFSSVERNTKSQRGCSIDSLAYFRHQLKDKEPTLLPDNYTLYNTVYEDLAILDGLYEHRSGGLMLESLDLRPNSYGMINNLSKEYLLLGFKRKRFLLSLKSEGYLKAILMINTSDIGLNMAEFTSCVKIFIIDARDLSKTALTACLDRICRNLKKTYMPVFTYPAALSTELPLPHDQTYCFWALDTQYTDQLFKQIKRLMEEAD